VIAPIHRTENAPQPSGMRLARRLAAAALLKQPSCPADHAPPVPSWRAWLFTTWAVVATAVYVAHMAGLL
jgi:hypothetical protein